ncbi:unnamed protein product [Moneuplotes crassus]|uniref:Uncharacterized protein n=1 Tax=Euplotes crassus TaxID=5936 RepID=A0AAD1XB08_EUPCR|nr:unnamed protein product [Moneuplotes crassus]
MRKNRNSGFKIFHVHNKSFLGKSQRDFPRKCRVPRCKMSRNSAKIKLKQSGRNLSRICQKFSGVSIPRAIQTSIGRPKPKISRNTNGIEKSTEAESYERKSMLSTIQDIAKRYSIGIGQPRKLHNRSL